MEAFLIKHPSMFLNFKCLMFSLAIPSEPPMQSKRRTPGIPATIINGFHDDGAGGDREEYTLLGNQDKFSSNIKYKVKPNMYVREASPPKQRKLQVHFSRLGICLYLFFCLQH